MSMNVATGAAPFTFTDTLKGAGRKVAAFFAVLGAAKRAAAAARVGRRPFASDLRRLGISPETYPSC